MINLALVTVSDKKGIIDFAKELHQLNISIMSTGGTFKEIQSGGIPVGTVEDYTGSKEILDGRVKTLHPKIHGGILAVRDDKNHMHELKTSNIKPIDMVVVNLYPFEHVIHKRETMASEIIENIDIGGVTLLRASAKNFRHVIVLTDPNDYPEILSEIKNHGNVSLKTRFNLAVKAFEITSHYDSIIYKHLKENESLFISS